MPSFWHDIDYDSGSAREFAAELERASAVVLRARDALERQGTAAVEDWSGSARETFVSAAEEVFDRADNLQRELSVRAGQVRDELAEATSEQARRVMARERARVQMEGT